MFSIIKKYLNFFVPSYKELLDYGFKAKTQYGDFILFKKYPTFSLSVHQSVEPFNQKFGDLIDFEIFEACLVFEDIKDIDSLSSFLSENVDNVHIRDQIIFVFNNNMKFEMEEIIPIVSLIESYNL